MARFIVFEGIDGSGKSTVAREFYERWKSKDVVLTEEPTKTWLGDAVKRSHKEKLDPMAEAFLFLADRVNHTAQIKEWLKEGKLVICDRYYYSTVAYQGAALEGTVDFDPVGWLLYINQKASIEPDIAFFFKTDPEIAIERVKNRGAVSKFERLDFLRKVAANYQRLSKMCKNVVTIDSNRPLDAVIDDINARL